MTSKPAAFRLDTPDVVIAPLQETPIPPYRESEILIVEQPKRSVAAQLFWTGLGILLTLASSLAIARLIDQLFTIAPWLGGVGLFAAGLMLLAALVILGREIIILRRLARIDTLRSEAALAVLNKSDAMAAQVAQSVLSFTDNNPRTAAGRAAFASAVKDNIIDGLDRLRLVEREVLEPLDKEALRLISDAAKRTSVVTALSPRVAVDLLFVFTNTIIMVRKLAALYGGQPGTLGLLKLMRRMITHLALTGGMAAADTVVDQLVGAGLATKLSAKLGEGVLNGLLTARLGLAAIDLCRPLPFIGATKPQIKDFMAILKASPDA